RSEVRPFGEWGSERSGKNTFIYLARRAFKKDIRRKNRWKWGVSVPRSFATIAPEPKPASSAMNLSMFNQRSLNDGTRRFQLRCRARVEQEPTRQMTQES